MSTQLTTVEQETASFELIQRHAKMLSASTLVPKDFQGNMANCAIGLNIAKRLGADPFMVLQNIDVIHGRPSFRATFLIAMVNASGRFTPLQFRMTGEGQSRSCVAYCKDKESGESIEGPEITMAMAKAEGWSTKAGSKWLTMPELMLRYRAAAFFARLYAPDITLGMHTSEEAYDIEPEAPRKAVGRVLNPDGIPVKLANPYAEPAPEHAEAELEQEPPAPDGEPPHESPVEVSEDTERKQLLSDIRDTLAEADILSAEFIKNSRAAKLMKSGEQMTTCPIEQLRKIHAGRLALAQGTYQEGGEG